ncbi:uncharacterized protein FOMMEDRAFT_127753 [Fomitiporia mediterranea MF3/22]|uniref:uncharacterized protein n=1 Tax=Fomitiporia mediterranea (strain MF3/22) TaxID=694068 RepID=UPI0004407C37|nr:uncharacterized protein FOMMEDRAFT_127753 [Fomitiporia mediterranea MF3/22]EJD00276.1 hypothetical protein FOMMEDRAFT_127753 [Fomitiporia mediterranea MF3/22]
MLPLNDSTNCYMARNLQEDQRNHDGNLASLQQRFLSMCPTRPQQLSEPWKTFGNVNFPLAEELLAGQDDEIRERGLGDIDLKALAFACANIANVPTVPTIHLLGYGGYNVAILFTFTNGLEMVARVPFHDCPLEPRAIESQVATMTFVRLYLQVPTPIVYAWNGTADNPVRTPYIIMERVMGQSLYNCWEDLRPDERRLVLFEVAKYHAALAKPLPFSKCGCLFFSDDAVNGIVKNFSSASAYKVGPFVQVRPRHLANSTRTAPTFDAVDDIRTYWMQCFQTECQAYHGRKKPDDFDNIAGLVNAFIQSCSIRSPNWLSICHGDMSVRNIMRKDGKVTGFLDWDGTAVLPISLFQYLLQDLCTVALWPAHLRSGDYFPFSPPDAIDELEVLQALPGGYARLREMDVWPVMLNVATIAQDEELARLRKVYPYYLRAWDEKLEFFLWNTCDDAKIAHELARRGFHEWERRKNWLRSKLQSPYTNTSNGHMQQALIDIQTLEQLAPGISKFFPHNPNT